MAARKHEVTVALSDVVGSLELQNRQMTSLDFPGCYGQSRDALRDAAR